MMTIRERTYPSYSTATTLPRVSWPAIFAGAISSIAIMGSLGLLGMALGAIQLPQNTIVLQSITAPATFWLVTTCALAFYCGGWACGRLAATGGVGDSVLHGLVAWAAATVALLLLFQPAAHVFRVNGLRIDAAATLAFGRAGFLAALFGAIGSALGAASGTRLYLPVPVDQYERTVTTRRHQGAGTITSVGTAGFGR